MFTRPRRGETEEDLLRQQEEFLRDKNSPPSAAVIKRKSQHESERCVSGKVLLIPVFVKSFVKYLSEIV